MAEERASPRLQEYWSDRSAAVIREGSWPGIFSEKTLIGDLATPDSLSDIVCTVQAGLLSQAIESDVSSL